jgi:hypothetical protein
MHWMVLHRPVELAALTGKVDFEAVKKPNLQNGFENLSQLEAR